MASSAPTSVKIATARLRCSIASSASARRVVQVREVVLEGGLPVAVAVGDRQLQRALRQLARPLELAGVALHQREVVERRGPARAPRSSASARLRSSSCRAPPEVPAAPGEHAEHVVGLRLGPPIGGGVGQLERFAPPERQRRRSGRPGAG